MYSITGATGRVGSAAAAALLAQGAEVRVVVRDPVRAGGWQARGAEIAVADLDDRRALARALSGSAGAFVLLPFDLGGAPLDAETRARVEAIAGAVTDSGVPHVVVLSSLGAHRPTATGPIVALHQLEEAVRSTPAIVTALRATHFQEKVADVIPAAVSEGIYPVLAGSADRLVPMVATRDIGAVIARSLISPPRRSEVVDVLGPCLTERGVAALLGQVLGRPLDVVVVPRAGWHDALVQAGLPVDVARLLVELHEADEDGLLEPRGDRTELGATPMETTLSALVAAATAVAPLPD